MGDTAGAAAPGAHPEEMRAEVEFSLRDRVRCRMMFRATPAGLIAAALLVAAITMPLCLWRRPRMPA